MPGKARSIGDGTIAVRVVVSYLALCIALRCLLWRPLVR